MFPLKKFFQLFQLLKTLLSKLKTVNVVENIFLKKIRQIYENSISFGKLVRIFNKEKPITKNIIKSIIFRKF